MADQKRYPCVLLFGGPGCGKGTQGSVLGAMPNMVHLAMGDIFRGLDKNSDIGKECESYASKGQLVPDELTMRVFSHHVDAKIATGEIDLEYHTIVLDGIPRTIAQVELLKDLILVKRVVFLKMDDRDALIARLSGRATKSGRTDDADPDVITNRLNVYERETAPVLHEFPKKLIAKINADQPPLAVLRDVADALTSHISPRI